MSQPSLADDKQFFVTLVLESEHPKNLNQVSDVTSQNIYYITSKRVGLSYEVLKFPIHQCDQIGYHQIYDIKSAAFAIVSLLVGGWVGWKFFTTSHYIATFPLLVFGVFPVWGIRTLFGLKRHLLTFRIEGKFYRWKSRPFEFSEKSPDVLNIMQFAEQTGRFRN